MKYSFSDLLLEFFLQSIKGSSEIEIIHQRPYLVYCLNLHRTQINELFNSSRGYNSITTNDHEETKATST